jgi:hypothetical protein
MKNIKYLFGIVFLFAFCITVSAQVMSDGGFEDQGEAALDEPWWIDTEDGSVPLEATIEVDMGSGNAMEGDNCLKIVTTATGQWIAVGQDLFVEPNTDYIMTFYLKADNNIAWDGNILDIKGYMKVTDENGALGDPYVPHYWDGGEAWAPATAGEIVYGGGYDMSIWRDYNYKFNSGDNTEVWLVIGTYVNNIVTIWVDGFSVAKVEEADVMTDGGFEDQAAAALGDPWWVDSEDGSVPAGSTIEVSMSSGESIEGLNHLEFTASSAEQWIAIGQDLVVEENTDYYVEFYMKGGAILWDDNPLWCKGYMKVTDGNGTPLNTDQDTPHYSDGGEFGAPWAPGELVFGEAQMMLPWRDYTYRFNSGPNTEVYLAIGTYVNNAASWKLDGFKVYKSLSGATAVEKEQGTIPDEYALSQNYPNPFNPSTTIKFSLPEASNVDLKVYDALGNIVENLADGSYSAGVYEINFNAQNISSGVYFYRLKTNNFLQTRKLMLLK